MRKELSDGLVLRSISEGVASDRENLPQFYGDTFSEAYGDPEDQILAIWTRDLLKGNHPTVTDDDVWVVVDTAKDDMIVSAVLLIPQVWRYEDVELAVGRPELVATHKDYRNRGLVRELFKVAHARSEGLGHNVQTITGIPYYYRQFGYAMAVDLGSCGNVPLASVPKLKDDEQPAYTLRLATMDDIPQLMAWYDAHSQRAVLSTVRPTWRWEYDFSGRDPASNTHNAFHIIVAQDGTEVGYVSTPTRLWGNKFGCLEYVVGEQASYLDTYDDVLRSLKTLAEQYATEEKPAHFLQFDSNIYESLELLFRQTPQASFRQTRYAWYMRVVDLVKFIQDISPVLERRLEGSLAHRFSGELKISFYRTGLGIKFEHGRIVEVNDTLPPLDKEDAAFPYHTFLNVVFGHRTVDDLNRVLPDAYTSNRKGEVLLSVLFPKKRQVLAALA